MLKAIPNIITASNLFFGCISAVMVFNGSYKTAFLFLALALLADFMDGASARLLDAGSEIGKQLDSLADVVSFGWLPGLIVFQFWHTQYPDSNLSWMAFLLTVATALRLAKFNIDPEQSYEFKGLASPANALFFGSWLIFPDPLPQWLSALFATQAFYAGIVLLFSYLLICRLPMFSLKIQHFRWAGNEIKIIFVLLSVVLAILFQLLAPALVIALYIFLSLIQYLSARI